MIVTGANVLLTYHIAFDGRDKDGRRPVRAGRHNRGQAAEKVDAAMESGVLVIPYTAAAEARRAALDVVRSTAKDVGEVEYDEVNVTKDVREKNRRPVPPLWR